MFKREHAMRETYDILKEAAEGRAAKDKELTEKKMKEKEDFYDAMNRIRKQRELQEADYENFSNALYDNHLQTVIEAVYISALQEVSSLTDDGIAIAQKLVENYIKEHGGAVAIMNSNAGKTYLLDFMFECVSKAHDTDMLTFLEAEEADKKEKENEEEEAKKEVEDEVEKDTKGDAVGADDNESGENISVGDADGDGTDDAKEADPDEEKKADGDVEEKDEDSKEDAEKSEEKSEESDTEEKKEDDKDPVDDLDVEDEEEAPAEEDKSEEGEEEKSEEPTEDDGVDDGFGDADAKEDEAKDAADAPDPGMEEVEDSKDEDFDTKDSKADMFEKLENDDTVVSAVDIIAKRVADAEAEFIKKNAEDKQKIEAIADKIDERIKAVTDTDKTGEEKETEHEELKQEATRMISNVRNDRIQGVFEFMINMNANAVVTDSVLKESYTLESGKLDFARIEEATLVQYGFLEFLNTVQLENVNEDYIAKVLHQEV